jgi:hypothetical protein
LKLSSAKPRNVSLKIKEGPLRSVQRYNRKYVEAITGNKKNLENREPGRNSQKDRQYDSAQMTSMAMERIENSNTLESERDNIESSYGKFWSGRQKRAIILNKYSWKKHRKCDDGTAEQ